MSNIATLAQGHQQAEENCLDTPAKKFRLNAKRPQDHLFVANAQRNYLKGGGTDQGQKNPCPTNVPQNFDCTPTAALLPEALDWDPSEGLIVECKYVQKLQTYHQVMARRRAHIILAQEVSCSPTQIAKLKK